MKYFNKSSAVIFHHHYRWLHPRIVCGKNLFVLLPVMASKGQFDKDKKAMFSPGILRRRNKNGSLNCKLQWLAACSARAVQHCTQGRAQQRQWFNDACSMLIANFPSAWEDKKLNHRFIDLLIYSSWLMAWKHDDFDFIQSNFAVFTKSFIL